MTIAEHEGIPDFLRLAPPMPPWTFTMLSTYRNICGHQAYRRYILKDIPYQPTAAMEHGNSVHSAFELRVSGKKPLPDTLRHHEPIVANYDGRKAQTELQLAVNSDWGACDFFARNCYGRGKADLVIMEGESAYLADYKTGKVREDPFELEVQATLLHAKYPRLKKIVGHYIWLKENQVGTLYDLSDTGKTRREIDSLVRLIEADLKTGSFEKRKGPLCGWCSVKDCENWYDGGH